MDVRSARVRDELFAKWRDEIQSWAPAKRLRWLKSTEGIVALGAKRCRDLTKELQRKHDSIGRQVCSSTWVSAYDGGDELPPGFSWGKRVTLLPQSDGRRFSARLQLSKYDTRPGAGPLDDPTCGPGSRRWTPPNAVSLEDHLDGMSPDEALIWSVRFAAQSPSASSIQRIESAMATPIDGRW